MSTQCKACNVYLPAGFVDCPVCENPIDGSPRKTVKTSPAVPVVIPKVKLGWREWLGLAGIGMFILFIGVAVYRNIVPSESQIHDKQVGKVRLKCQTAIQSLAKFGGSDTPPYVANVGNGDTFRFVWPRGSFEFTNGFGAREKMSATCAGVISTGEIKTLTVNGKEIL
jgi:hypothetical protein